MLIKTSTSSHKNSYTLFHTHITMRIWAARKRLHIFPLLVAFWFQCWLKLQNLVFWCFDFLYLFFKFFYYMKYKQENKCRSSICFDNYEFGIVYSLLRWSINWYIYEWMFLKFHLPFNKTGLCFQNERTYELDIGYLIGYL